VSDVRRPLAGLARGTAVALGLGLAALALAGEVPDPTRPSLPTPVSEADASEGEAREAAPLVLQSTLVSPRQQSAIINGQRYRVGDTVGEARLEAIGTGWVRLATPTGPRELRLSFPTTTRPVNR
jgi:hypothetical protein